MSNTSYMFSFVLGLIVVLVFIVVLNSRFHFVSKLMPFATTKTIAIASPTPAPTGVIPEPTFPAQNSAPAQARVLGGTVTVVPTAAPTAQPTMAPTVAPTTAPVRAPAQNSAPVATNKSTSRPVSQIPNTGFPTEAIPMIATSLYVGLKLRRA